METCYKFFLLTIFIGDFLKQGLSDSANESHSIDATLESVVSLLKTLATTKEDENSSMFSKNTLSYSSIQNESEQHINVTAAMLTSTEYVTLLGSGTYNVTSTTMSNGKFNILSLQDQFYIMCAVIGTILCLLCLGYLFLFKDMRRLKKRNRTYPGFIQNSSHDSAVNDGPSAQSSRNIAPDEELAKRGFTIYDGSNQVRFNSRSGVSNSCFAEENYPMEVRNKPE